MGATNLGDDADINVWTLGVEEPEARFDNWCVCWLFGDAAALYEECN